VPDFAGGHFERDTFFFGERGNIGFRGDAFDPEFFAEGFNEGFVAVGFRAANGMIQVRGGQLVSEAMKDVKQCDGVGPAGNAGDDMRAFGNQVIPFNRRFNFFDQVHNRKLPRTAERIATRNTKIHKKGIIRFLRLLVFFVAKFPMFGT
jgi:hypothetical protein